MIELFETIGTPLIVGILLAYFQHANNKRYDKMDTRAELRKKEAIVNAKVTEATMELSFAVAMAIKRGEPNGEVEKAIKSYKTAKKAKEDFLHEVGAEYLK